MDRLDEFKKGFLTKKGREKRRINDPFKKEAQSPSAVLGELIHAKVQAEFAQRGILGSAEANLIDIPNQMASKVDAILSSGEIVEIKSVGLEELRSMTGPRFDHVAQALYYLSQIRTSVNQYATILYVAREAPGVRKAFRVYPNGKHEMVNAQATQYMIERRGGTSNSKFQSAINQGIDSQLSNQELIDRQDEFNAEYRRQRRIVFDRLKKQARDKAYKLAISGLREENDVKGFSSNGMAGALRVEWGSPWKGKRLAPVLDENGEIDYKRLKRNAALNKPSLKLTTAARKQISDKLSFTQTRGGMKDEPDFVRSLFSEGKSAYLYDDRSGPISSHEEFQRYKYKKKTSLRLSRTRFASQKEGLWVHASRNLRHAEDLQFFKTIKDPLCFSDFSGRFFLGELEDKVGLVVSGQAEKVWETDVYSKMKEGRRVATKVHQRKGRHMIEAWLRPEKANILGTLVSTTFIEDNGQKTYFRQDTVEAMIKYQEAALGIEAVAVDFQDKDQIYKIREYFKGKKAASPRNKILGPELEALYEQRHELMYRDGSYQYESGLIIPESERYKFTVPIESNQAVNVTVSKEEINQVKSNKTEVKVKSTLKETLKKVKTDTIPVSLQPQDKNWRTRPKHRPPNPRYKGRPFFQSPKGVGIYPLISTSPDSEFGTEAIKKSFTRKKRSRNRFIGKYKIYKSKEFYEVGQKFAEQQKKRQIELAYAQRQEQISLKQGVAETSYQIKQEFQETARSFFNKKSDKLSTLKKLVELEQKASGLSRTSYINKEGKRRTTRQQKSVLQSLMSLATHEKTKTGDISDLTGMRIEQVIAKISGDKDIYDDVSFKLKNAENTLYHQQAFEQVIEANKPVPMSEVESSLSRFKERDNILKEQRSLPKKLARLQARKRAKMAEQLARLQRRNIIGEQKRSLAQTFFAEDSNKLDILNKLIDLEQEETGLGKDRFNVSRINDFKETQKGGPSRTRQAKPILQSLLSIKDSSDIETTMKALRIEHQVAKMAGNEDLAKEISKELKKVEKEYLGKGYTERLINKKFRILAEETPEQVKARIQSLFEDEGTWSNIDKDVRHPGQKSAPMYNSVEEYQFLRKRKREAIAERNITKSREKTKNIIESRLRKDDIRRARVNVRSSERSLRARLKEQSRASKTAHREALLKGKNSWNELYSKLNSEWKEERRAERREQRKAARIQERQEAKIQKEKARKAGRSSVAKIEVERPDLSLNETNRSKEILKQREVHGLKNEKLYTVFDIETSISKSGNRMPFLTEFAATNVFGHEVLQDSSEKLVEEAAKRRTVFKAAMPSEELVNQILEAKTVDDFFLHSPDHVLTQEFKQGEMRALTQKYNQFQLKASAADAAQTPSLMKFAQTEMKEFAETFMTKNKEGQWQYTDKAKEAFKDTKMTSSLGVFYEEQERIVKEVAGFFEDTQKANGKLSLVGHNISNFDIPMLDSFFKEKGHLTGTQLLKDSEVIDTLRGKSFASLFDRMNLISGGETGELVSTLKTKIEKGGRKESIRTLSNLAYSIGAIDASEFAKAHSADFDVVRASVPVFKFLETADNQQVGQMMETFVNLSKQQAEGVSLEESASLLGDNKSVKYEAAKRIMEEGKENSKVVLSNNKVITETVSDFTPERSLAALPKRAQPVMQELQQDLQHLSPQTSRTMGMAREGLNALKHDFNQAMNIAVDAIEEGGEKIFNRVAPILEKGGINPDMLKFTRGKTMAAMGFAGIAGIIGAASVISSVSGTVKPTPPPMRPKTRPMFKNHELTADDEAYKMERDEGTVAKMLRQEYTDFGSGYKGFVGSMATAIKANAQRAHLEKNINFPEIGKMISGQKDDISNLIIKNESLKPVQNANMVIPKLEENLSPRFDLKMKNHLEIVKRKERFKASAEESSKALFMLDHNKIGHHL